MHNYSVEKKRRNQYAVALGRNGGRKGGPARASSMTPEQRTESVRNADMARWAKDEKEELKPKTRGNCYACDRRGIYGQKREGQMSERKIKMPFPTPTSPQVDGVEVSIKESTERWTDVELEDGAVLRLKPAVLGAVRIDGQFDPDGNPMYALRIGQVMTIISAPDSLKKPQPEAKVN